MEKIMMESLKGQSAQIVQFPAGGRAGFGGRRDDAKPAEPFAPRAAKVVSGAWYHEVAIEDACRGSQR
jgi:hypothetical protein